MYGGVNTTSLDELLVSVPSNPGGENPFQSRHTKLDGSLGLSIEDGATETWRHFVQSGPSSFANYVPPEAPDPDWDAANLWARTNPTRPAVLIPVFLVELREIPRLIRDAGRALRRESDLVSDDNLAVQFGALPLFRDLWSIANLQASVEKRRKEIENSTKRGGYRHRITVGATSFSSSSSYFANFGDYKNFPIEVQNNATKKAWAVLKWKPTGNGGLPVLTDNLAKYIGGYHPSQVLLNLWEGLPWTWLIDYFTNIGDVLAAGNHFAMTPNGGSVMTTSIATGSHDMQLGFPDILTAGTVRVTTHGRHAIDSTPIQAFLPSLSAGQLSVLGSLASRRK